MKESIINFEDSQCDLPRFNEEWHSSDYSSMKKHLIALIESIKKYKPRSHSMPIRKGTFLIKKSTTVDALIKLGKEIDEKFGIHCFQVAIDREHNTALMLFSWVNEATAEMYVLNHTDLKKLSVLILRHLNLPRPDFAELWVRYFLIDAYEEDPDIFRRQMQALSHWNLDKESYEILYDSLSYSNLVCQGLVK